MDASGFEQELTARLAALRTQGLARQLRRVDSPQGPRLVLAGRTLLNFSSNDYLGLANDPALREAAVRAVEQFGAGAGASRLICGSLGAHHELDEALAAFKGTPAALSFSSGYTAALGTICALLGKDDVIVIDRLVHACLVDAARLCGAKLRVFAHNDLDQLEAILQWTRRSAVASARRHVLVVTESVFSMDGDRAPLREIADLKDRYGAWLLVDEAHATGLYGANRRGLAEALGVSERIEIQMGTLGKAIGSAGGFIAGSRALIDYLVHRARSFVFSTAPVPAAAAAATAGVRLVQSAEGATRCAQLWERVQQWRAAVQSAGLPEPGAASSAICPLLIGEETRALAVADRLREAGVFIPAIRYPTVARGQARLRVTLTAAHTEHDIAALLRAMESVGVKDFLAVGPPARGALR
jgi:8-amino-7-oxononanoate synthase